MKNKIKRFFSKRELIKQIAFTLFCMFLFRLGSNIIISSVDTSVIGGVQGFDLFNLLTGADMGSFSLFALGLSPFITGSIVIELLSNDVIPVFSRWKKDNENTKRTTASNVCGLIIAVIQAFSITLALDRSYGMLRSDNIYSYLYTAIIMVVGSCILLWISKQIDTYGLGNGSSIIIVSGILYKMPGIIDDAYNIVVTYKDLTTLISFALLMAVFISVIFFVVFTEKSEKRIRIAFSFGSRSVVGQKDNYLPIKVNVSGVIPVIFASSVLQIPSLISKMFNKEYEWMSFFSLSDPKGIVLYVLLIIFFVYYYSHTLINAKDINSNFRKSGCSIISVRPGQDTIDYINRHLNYLCVFGSVSLVFIALIPVVVPMIWTTAASSGLTLGGTSLIIVTGVTLEIYRKIKTEMTRFDYKKQSFFWR